MSSGVAQGVFRGEYFIFSESALSEAGRGLRDSYISAQPYPHAVLDSFLPELFADRICNEFPAAHLASVNRTSPEQYLKRAFRPDDLGEELSRVYVQPFSTRPFLAFLESLTGIQGLIPDPYYAGAGYHEILPGGRLAIHADFDVHPTLDLVRRVNFLLFLNRNWLPAYGGNLELWDASISRCAVSIPPVFNRCVVFSTSQLSFHGHPGRLACPANRTRRSMALYYYTSRAAGRDDGRVSTRTDWRGRPGESARFSHRLRAFFRAPDH
jgi:2OG-Fe(II) oxygenase superfamily